MCRKDFIFLIICYKFIDIYPRKLHFPKTDSLIARNRHPLTNLRYLFIMCVRYDNINFRKKTYELRVLTRNNAHSILIG